MNGFTLCHELKKHPASASIPILMVTGMHGTFTKLNSMAHGADGYLAKPFKPEELIASVNKLLG